jgi:RNA polymerase sigma-70 factor (ECF subfamily)
VTALASIFQEHADFVWRALRRLGVPAGDVDDALQEVFLVVHRRLADYEDQGHMRAWLFSISRQIASHYHRAQKRRHDREQHSIERSAPLDQDQVLARREAEHLVNTFLEGLDEPRRLVFYLSDVEGLPAPEIAVALGMNVNTVYGRLRQARARFEEAVQAFGGGT